MIESYDVLDLTLFLGFTALNVYVLKFFLKIPFETAFSRYFKMMFIEFLYLLVALMPVGVIWNIVKIMYPDFLLTYQTMDSLFSIRGASAIWHEGLSTGQLMWAPLFVIKRMAFVYAGFYISCYVYEHHIDASVDKSRLKKAILLITVFGLVPGWIINLGFMLFVK